MYQRKVETIEENDIRFEATIVKCYFDSINFDFMRYKHVIILYLT